MLEIIKKQFRIRMDEWLFGIVLMLGGAVFGLVLWAAIIRGTGEELYFTLGTILAAIIAVGYIAIIMLIDFSNSFHIEISLGCTRKRFLTSWLLMCVIWGCLYVLVLLGLNVAENALLTWMYQGAALKINFIPYLLKYGFAVALGLPMVTGLCASLCIRFGRKASWTLWVFWMLGCVGIPRFSDAAEEHPGSVFGQIGLAFRHLVELIPVNVWLPAAAIFCLLCLWGTWMILRRQQVG